MPGREVNKKIGIIKKMAHKSTKLPSDNESGSPADVFVCIQPKGCSHFYRYWEFGSEAPRIDLTNDEFPEVPHHFRKKTPELMLVIRDHKKKSGLPKFNLAGVEVQ